MLYPEVDACDLAAAGARGAAMTDGAGGSTLELPSGEVVWRRVAEWSLADDETPGTAGAGGSSGGGSSARPEEG